MAITAGTIAILEDAERRLMGLVNVNPASYRTSASYGP
jgi:hypothetical protein